MIKLFLAVFGPRFLTTEGRRTLIIGSFYTLISGRSGGCHRLATTMNRKLHLVDDPRGLLLGTILPEILWGEKECTVLREMPPEKIVGYFEQKIPRWLKDGVNDQGFNLSSELNRVISLRPVPVVA